MSNNDLIYKDNKIIEASYKLTLIEQRLILFAISQVNATEKLSSNDVFKITASQYSSMFKLNNNDVFREIKEAMDSLFERRVKVIVSEDKTEEIRWISRKSTTLSDQSIEIRFTPDIAPYLHNLKGNFTKYQFKNIAGMSSAYAIRFYEMLMQWKSTKSLTLTVDQIRDRMQLYTSSYNLFGNIKAKVIDVAVKEINQYTDITVSYSVRKMGRRIESVKFDYAYKAGMEPKTSKETRKATIEKLKEAIKR